MDAMMKSMKIMMETEYDPNDPIPLSNKEATMYGATIPFHILSWAAVCFRLYTRFRVVRDPGLDDYFIIAAAVINLACLVATLDSIKYGLGLHVGQILKRDGSGMAMMVECMKRGYVQNATYLACSGVVKMSLLFQYLRIFKEGKTRKVCQFMLLLTIIWSMIGFMQGWFPCFPASGFWNRQQTPPPKCWGLGFGELQSARMALYGFAASNMVLDAIIFAIPTSVYWRPGIGRKEVMALTALFSLGAIVVLMAILRLWAIARHDTGPNVIFAFDFTWWFPLTLIFSALEIDFAIITASIPIFWPVIVRSLPQIFVTQEIHVTHHSNNDFEMGRPQSLKSNNSQEGLTRVLTAGAKNNFTDYSNSFGSEPMPPNRIEIGGKQQKAWGR